MSPFEKMHKRAYIPIHNINCHNFNFYWRAQNNKICMVEHSIFLYQAQLIIFIQLKLQILYMFLLISPILEHSQVQQWSLDGLTFGVCETIMVLAYGRDLCVWDSSVRRYGGANITPPSLPRMGSQPPGCPREVGECFRVNVVLRFWPQIKQLWRSKSTWGSYSCHSLLIVIFVYISIFFGFS